MHGGLFPQQSLAQGSPAAVSDRLLQRHRQGLAIKGMTWLFAPSGNNALLEDYKPVAKTDKHERLPSVHLNAEVPQRTAHHTENITARYTHEPRFSE